MLNSQKFWEYVKGIHPFQLNIEKTNQSDSLASYLDLTSTTERGGDFDYYIVNFLFPSSDIPSRFGPSNGVYNSQLIRYARCCSYFDDFRHRHKVLAERLVSEISI